MAPLSSNTAARIVFWIPFVCVALHIVEEFVWPGGFLDWYRSYRPDLAASITPRFAVIGNIVLVVATVVLGIMGPNWSRSLSLWFVLAALLAGNAIWHIRGTIRSHKYSQGAVTGALLYLPLLLGGLWYFLVVRSAPVETVIVGCAVGATYQFVSEFLHRGLAPSQS